MQVDPHSNDGAPPTTYGEGERPPRGDYARAGADYTFDQQWEAYTEAEHDLYRRLHARQSAQLEGLACSEFIGAVAELGAPESIPKLAELSQRLERATAWRLVAVPGLIPEDAFFGLLAQRRFPVTNWIRRPEEFDYVVEPDLFHDLFGHVPLLFNPVFANYMQAYGAGGLKAGGLASLEFLSRLYWYTVEFGLINTPQGVRAYGAGLLSSAGELRASVLGAADGPHAARLPFDLARIMRTRYRIDSFQQTYFVIDSFDQLFAATAVDFAPLYRSIAALPSFDPPGSGDDHLSSSANTASAKASSM